MTKIYSKRPNRLYNEQPKQDKIPQLSTDDELFFDAIKNALHQIEKEPSDETVAKILKYSKNL